MKILIIDDDRETCRVIETYLKQKGYLTKCVYDGQSGLEEIKRNEFDRVVLDLSMREMSGIGFLSEVRKMNLIEHSKIVIYSAAPFTDGDKDIFLKNGIRGFISKGEAFSELVKILI